MNIQSILQHYQVGELKETLPLSVASANETYKIETDTGKFIVRVYNPAKTEAEIIFEHTILHELSANNFIAPKPIETVEGKLYGRTEKYFALYDYIHGHNLKGPEISLEHIHSVGETLGWFHEILTDYNTTETKPRFDWPTTWQYCEQIKKEKHGVETSNVMAEIQKALLEARLNEALPMGIVHGDLHEQNVVFRHGHVAGVLDFDQCTYGTIVADVATGIIWWCFRDATYHAHLAKGFLQGYLSQRTMTPEEKQFLWIALKFAVLRLRLATYVRELSLQNQTESYAARSEIITSKYFQGIYNYIIEKKERIIDSWSFLL